MTANNGSAREALIETAADLLWERGYAATSPRAILDGAGVGQGSMYHHFAGKEALAVAAFERNSDAVHEKAVRVLRGPGSPFERLCAYLLLQREVLRGCPVGRMAGDPDVVSTPSLHAVLAETFARVRDITVAVVAEAVEAGELAADVEPDELAETVLAVVQGGYVLARAAASPAPFDRAVAGAVTLLKSIRTEAIS